MFGGFHGDEPKSTAIALLLIEYLAEQMETGTDAHWVIMPCVNPDGLDLRRRRNARLVDLNRNFPTKNWAHTPLFADGRTEPNAFLCRCFPVTSFFAAGSITSSKSCRRLGYTQSWVQWAAQESFRNLKSSLFGGQLRIRWELSRTPS